MPRIRQKAESYAGADFWKAIDAKCAESGIKTNEQLAKIADVSGVTIGTYRKEPEKIRAETMRRMVTALKPDILPVLAFLGYSEKEVRRFARVFLMED